MAVAVLLLSAVAMSATAAEQDSPVRVHIGTHGDVVVSGRITTETVLRVKRLLASSPSSVKRLVFDHCLGGTMGPSTDLARVVRQHRLETVARRQCSSGCALAFLAGATKSVDTTSDPVLIGLHMPYSFDGAATENPAFFLRMLDVFTSRKLRGKHRDLVMQTGSATTGLFFVFRQDGSAASFEDHVRFCTNESKLDIMACDLIVGADAVTLGIIDRRY